MKVRMYVSMNVCLDFAAFDLSGDNELSIPSRINSNLLSLNIKPRPRPAGVIHRSVGHPKSVGCPRLNATGKPELVNLLAC